MTSTQQMTTPLEDLAEKINEAHNLTVEHAGKAIEHACRAGEWLNQAKSQVNHGEWLPWLADNVQFSERTARGYMRVSKNLPKLAENGNGVADLSLRAALKILATPVVDGSPDSEAEAYADLKAAMETAIDAGNARDALVFAVTRQHVGLIAMSLDIKREVEGKELDWSALRDTSSEACVVFDFAFYVDEHMDPMGDDFMEIRERLEPARMEFREVIASEEGNEKMRAAFEQRLSR